ncbi:MAG TPA: tetratricopeptide repeat protein [Candidatus Acidoferrales bacterium]|jgi:tetratricopeptide (TPR) repeat protein|nr:tetratricopeptide repeat protein [Candidatus Acidoferrales bacterium]
MKAVILQRWLGCAAVFAIAAGSSGVAAAQAPANSSPTSRAETVVIFPFENAGREPGKDWLGEGLAELTADRLEGHGPMVFTREERLAALEKLGLPAYSRFTRATMLKIAAEIDADYAVFGDFTPNGTGLRITARVLSVNPPKLSQLMEEAGTLENLGEVDARISWRVFCQIHSALALDAPCDATTPAARQFLSAGSRIRPDALERFVRGLLASKDDAKLAEFREAAKLDPEWDEPVYATGKIYYARMECESALSWFTRVPAGSPHAKDASFAAGVCRLAQNDPLGAESVFAALAGHAGPAPPPRPEVPEVANNLGAAVLRQARYKDALPDFEKAKQLDPGEPDYWFNVGLAEYLLGDWGAAGRALREALRLQPEAQDARALLLAALDHNGETEEANALRADAPPRDPTDVRPRQDIPRMNATALSKMARVRREMNAGAAR